MQLSEYPIVVQKIHELADINIDAILEQAYNKENIIDIQEDSWKIYDIMYHYKRVVKQFKDELENPDFRFYPNEFFTHGNTYTLTDVLNNLHGYLLGFNTEGSNYFKNIHQLVFNIRALITYQIVYGFWDNSEKKVHDVNVLELDKATEELKTAIKQLKKEKTDFETKKLELDTKINDFNTLFQSKVNEAAEISNRRNEVVNFREEVSRIRDESINKGSEIQSAYNTQAQFIEDIKRQKENQENEFRTFLEENFKKKDSEYAGKLLELDTKINDFNESKKRFDEHEEHVKNKIKEIETLASFAADVSLGNSFNRRAEQIKKSVKFWRGITFTIAISTVIWILIVFLCLSPTEGDVWSKLLINSIKSLPAFILLGFAMGQYNKERNLEEEYAFKTSVAVTVNAYADQVGSAEISPEKVKMIQETIERLYTKPKIQDFRNSSKLSFTRGVKKEDLESIIKTVVESLGKK
jgi:hypothetical protein